MAPTTFQKHASKSTTAPHKSESNKTPVVPKSQEKSKQKDDKKDSSGPSRPQHITGARAHYNPAPYHFHPHLTYATFLNIEEDFEVTCHPHLTYVGYPSRAEDFAMAEDDEDEDVDDDENDIEEARRHSRKTRVTTHVHRQSVSMTSPRYTVYHSHYSLPSIIARFLVAVRGSPIDGLDDGFTEQVIDVFAGEQLSALFQAGGDVVADIPALRNESSRDTVSGPIEIARHLSDRYPALFPAKEADTIKAHIARLHDLDWFSLSLPVPRPSRGGDDQSREALQEFQHDLEQRLEGGASAWYRAALMYRLRTFQSPNDEVSRIYEVRARARHTLEAIEGHVVDHRGHPWIFGFERPSALDAHLVPSLARLEDAGNGGLIPPRLKGYLDAARRTQYWREVMGDRKTLR
ncbi:hypothetical protein M409DRAFT_49123 [Zasmidium cellare ATCC 36951]|uniref:GST C-terminal domain-containing protein n=1 Tax=Zasmidium cellare ATCC 36951 TaxID=1080233 RepID=A0A6A6D5D2_ZASCE|nr:uncharacterized protein M409DRAFT_49123 [Zasmidium cellare ATCC 36951]KAF2174265.1 hypothetical protein M409DRAFT_49123 [Zasmidium cellare ATCC 36951]